LSNLQQRGFKTFGSLWDESYDQLEGPARWQAITYLINDLIALPDTEWRSIVEQSLDITRHNRTVVRNIIRDLKGI
jgi:hypothetical protein